MPLVTINSPKTPITKGSNGIAAATVPNVCKMPGLPAPLPNIGQSGRSPEGYSKTVTIEGDPVAIRGASFGSVGDIASKATGGGIVSNNVEGPTKFIAPGSLNVMIEGRNVQLLGDQMMNNCGPSGSPPNAATMAGVVQPALLSAEKALQDAVCECDKDEQPAPDDTCRSLGEKKHACVNRRMHRHNCENRSPKLGGEQGYNVKTGEAVPTPRMQLIGEPYVPDYVKRIAGNLFPDAAVLDNFGRPVQFAEFKF